MNSRRFFLLCILLLTPAGCGLKEYEERMDQQRKLASTFDQAESLLDERLVTPQVGGTLPWRFDVYLRLPRGFQPKFKKDYSYLDVTLFQYPFVKDGQEKVDRNIFVGSSAKEIASDVEFRQRVLNALKDYIQELNGLRVFKLDPPRSKFVTLGDEQEFVAVEFDGPGNSLFQVYVQKNGTNHFAIVFQTPRDDGVFSDSRDACLKSLDMSSAAAGKRQRFDSRKAKK